MSKFFLVFCFIIGSLIGVWFGRAFDTALDSPDEINDPQSLTAQQQERVDDAKRDASSDINYVALKNQFVVPVFREGKVVSLVVLSISLESTPSESASVLAHEPKIRDSLLQVLFDQSNLGTFSGSFTESLVLESLRAALFEGAKSIVGSAVRGVIITDIARQEL